MDNNKVPVKDYVLTAIILFGFLLILMIKVDSNSNNLIKIDDSVKYFNNEIKEIRDSEKLKETQILKLESKIESFSKSLDEKKKEIKNKNEKVKKKDDEIKQLEKELKSEKNKSENLKIELKNMSKLNTIDVKATAYTAFCPTGCIGITATGYNVKNTVYKDGYRVIAVDPKVIPLGSIVEVESSGMSFKGIAEDTGGAIKGNRIDILMKDRSEAYNYGVRNAKVKIIRKGR